MNILAFVSYLDVNRQRQTLNYPNLKLTTQRLKECRKEKRLTLKQLSNLMRINIEYLDRLENGDSLMGPIILNDFCCFYNKSVEYFTCSSDEKSEQLSLF